MSTQDSLPLDDDGEAFRQEEGRWWFAHYREILAAGGKQYSARKSCPTCDTRNAVLTPRNGQNTVRCANCGSLLYNAPKTETGEARRSVATVRQSLKPSQQARIFDRDHARCVLCGRGDTPLTIGHLLSVADGLELGASERELADDSNLAAMCEACNSGLGRTSVAPATYARIMLHLIRAADSGQPDISSSDESATDELRTRFEII